MLKGRMNPGLCTVIYACCLLFCTTLYPQINPAEDNNLYINSYPQGAQVCINDNYCGVTPYQAINLSGQDMRIKLTLNGKSREQVVAYFKGRYDVFMVMDGDYGIVNFVTTPDSMEVYVDNAFMGLTPLNNQTLPPGKHSLVIQRENYETIERDIYIKPTKYDFRFKTEFNSCFVTVKNKNIVDLMADNKSTEKKSDFEYKLTRGTHTIDLFASDYKRPITDEFTFEARKHYDLSVSYNYYTPKYLLYSALIPGLGQYMDRSALKGLGYLLGTLTGGILYLMADNNYSDLQPEYNRAKENYLKASYIVDINLTRSRLESVVDDINKYGNQRSLFLNVTAGFYLLNIIDAIIFHSNGSMIELQKRIETVSGPNGAGIKININ